MRILIEYDSCWHMSFLGDDDKKPINKVRPKTNIPNNNGYMKKFVATAKTQGQKESHTSDSTILGVLCRLIGDQRKLYQARNSDDFYFSDIEEKIYFSHMHTETVTELVYLTNKSDDRCGQGSWLGVLADENPWFDSPWAPHFWSILFLNRNELLEFILSEKPFLSKNVKQDNSKPTRLLSRLDKITDIKCDVGLPWFSFERLKIKREKIEKNIKVEQDKQLSYQDKLEKNSPKTDKQRLTHKNKLDKFKKNLEGLNNQLKNVGTFEECSSSENNLNMAISLITQIYPNNEYWKDGKLYPYRLYAAALYLQARRLIASGADLKFMFNKKNELQVQGFSQRGFNGVRDWLNSMTGSRKKAVGTPCNIKKQSGRLEIELRLDPQSQGLYFNGMSRAEEIKTLIENAGVSAFYLGKKGLAYVSKIRV